MGCWKDGAPDLEEQYCSRWVVGRSDLPDLEEQYYSRWVVGRCDPRIWRNNIASKLLENITPNLEEQYYSKWVVGKYAPHILRNNIIVDGLLEDITHGS